MQRTIKRQVYMISCPDLPVWMNTRISRVAPVSVSLSKSRSRWHKTLTSVPDSCGAWWCDCFTAMHAAKKPCTAHGPCTACSRSAADLHSASKSLVTACRPPPQGPAYDTEADNEKHSETTQSLILQTCTHILKHWTHTNTHGWVQVLVGLSI